MRQKAFSRPPPIKTKLSPEADTSPGEKPQPLPPPPLSPRTELELRRSCSALLSSPCMSSRSTSAPRTAAESYNQRPRVHIPSNAAKSFSQTTTKFGSSSSSPHTRTLTATTTKSRTETETPQSCTATTLPPYHFSKTAIARKMSFPDDDYSNTNKTKTPTPPPCKASEIGQAKPFQSSAVQVPIGLKRKPSLIQVGTRPKTASGGGRENRVQAWVQQEIDRRRNDHDREKDKLVLFPRPNTSHGTGTSYGGGGGTTSGSMLKKELADRPLPPLPQLPMRAKTVPLQGGRVGAGACGSASGGGGASGALRSFRRQLSLFFGKRKQR